MKVLVVEDEPIIRLGMMSSIEDAGYSVIEASSADEAIVRLAQDNEVGVVVTDVDMPGSMDGIKLAHFVKQRWPPISIIVVSGKLPAGEASLPVGSRFFAKPIQEESLRMAMRELTQ